MDTTELTSHLSLGETPSIEFKRCGNAPGADTFETICSFANGFGGSIFLGVEDDGGVVGIPHEKAAAIKRNIVNVVNNANVFEPPVILEFEDIDFEGANIIRIWVPSSPSIHSYKKKVYERIEDADIVVRTESQLTELCLRKQGVYTEQRVLPYVEASDLRLDMLPAIRAMALGKRRDHPWQKMTDEELLRSAGLLGKNYATNERGFNLAAVLLLGKTDVIRSLCPAYKTDALLQIDDKDRYDDRITVRENLIEAYDLLFDFCAKHLPDRFHLEGTVAVSPRDIIVREVVSNTLVHREFSSPLPARLVIDGNDLRAENASRAIFRGPIVLSEFNPVPKNPLIASFFNQIGLAEELGSGTRNLHKYAPIYAGGAPALEKGSVFRTTVPIRKRELPETRPTQLADVAALTMEIVAEKEWVGVSDLESRGIARRTAQRGLAELVEQGSLHPEGKGRSRKYVEKPTDARPPARS